MSLYNIKSNGSGYHIHKFDEDLNPQGDYNVTLRECECQAGHRPTCRHRQMLPEFQMLGRVNTGWMLEFDNREWFYLDQSVGLVPEKRVRGWWRRA